MNFELCGHSWAWEQLGDNTWSLKCLDPSIDENGMDFTSWPTDEELSERVGFPVEFYQAWLKARPYPLCIFVREVL